jgi:outer membrane protein OmpA-like peptidoglycan-associated protein/opacity protein-like surface antigen
MMSGRRLFATIAVAFLLVPVLRADDSGKAVTTASKDGAVNSTLASEAAGGATPASSTPLPAPVPQSRIGRRSSDTPRVELFGGYSFWRAAPISPGNRIAWTHGGSASVAYNLNDWLGLVADFAGFRVTRFGPAGTPTGGIVPASGNVFSYLAGPRFSYRKFNRITPFAQVLFGGAHASQVTLSDCAAVCTPLSSENAFAMTAGGGLDLKVSRRLAIRVVQAEYLLTRFADDSANTGERIVQNNVRLSTGIVFRFGSMGPAPAPVAAACFAEPAEVFAGEPVNGTATGSNFDSKSAIRYNWTGTGVRVTGSNASTQIDTTGLQPGTYQVSANLSDGSKNGVASCTAMFHVKQQQPPEIACSSDPRTLRAGGTATIRSNANSPDKRRLTYSYSASAGTVSGTDENATLNTAGASPGPIRVTCTVSDDRNPALTASAATTVTVEAPPPPPPPPPPAISAAEVTKLEARLSLHSIYFQTARPTLSDPNGGVLDSQQQILAALARDFKEYLGIRPEAHLTLEGHADPRGSAQYNQILTERRVDRAKSFLIGQGVPAEKIEVKAFGQGQNLSDDDVRKAVQQNPELSAGDRQMILNNMHSIILASNRRVDIVLSTTGQQSLRQYPFNAKDSLALISTQDAAAGKGTKTKKQ